MKLRIIISKYHSWYLYLLSLQIILLPILIILLHLVLPPPPPNTRICIPQGIQPKQLCATEQDDFLDQKCFKDCEGWQKGLLLC